MIELLRRIDRAVVRGESWIIVGTLISMVLVAGFQVGIRNLTHWKVGWASRLLMDMEWADAFLRNGTLWLAFVGASIATYKRKHISIDVLLRIVPARSKYWMLAVGGILAGLITLGLTYSFSKAVELDLTERPLEMVVLTDHGPAHLCDAKAEQLETTKDASRPTLFCMARTLLAVIHVPAETPGAMFQLVVPVMFFIIAVRLLCYGIGYVSVATGDDSAIKEADIKERTRLTAGQTSAFDADAGGENKGARS
jgi:TRAP-type C4-dicarboxylate transport system permease small subunit